MQPLEIKKSGKERLAKARETQIAYNKWRKGQGGTSPRPSDEDLEACEEIIGTFIDAVLEDSVTFTVEQIEAGVAL